MSQEGGEREQQVGGRKRLFACSSLSPSLAVYREIKGGAKEQKNSQTMKRKRERAACIAMRTHAPLLPRRRLPVSLFRSHWSLRPDLARQSDSDIPATSEERETTTKDMQACEAGGATATEAAREGERKSDRLERQSVNKSSLHSQAATLYQRE